MAHLKLKHYNYARYQLSNLNKLSKLVQYTNVSDQALPNHPNSFNSSRGGNEIEWKGVNIETLH